MADEDVLRDAAKLPLAEQLGHSNWRVRAQALGGVQERVGRAFSCEDDVFAEAGEPQGGAGERGADRRRRARPAAAATPWRRRLRAPTPPLPPALRPPPGPLLAKAVGDSNANVMDKAVETLVAYLEKADEALAARCVGGSSTCGCQPPLAA